MADDSPPPIIKPGTSMAGDEAPPPITKPGERQQQAEDDTGHWYSPFVEYGKGAAETFTGLETAARNLTGTKNLADPNSPYNFDEQMRRWANTQPTNQDWPEWLARTAGQATTGAVLAAPVGGVPGMFAGGALTGAGLNPQHPLEAGGISGLISTAFGWPLSRLAGAASRRAAGDLGVINRELYGHASEPLGMPPPVTATETGERALGKLHAYSAGELNHANSQLTLPADDNFIKALQRGGDQIGTTLSNSPQEAYWKNIMDERVLQPLGRSVNAGSHMTGREMNDYIGGINDEAAKLAASARKAPPGNPEKVGLQRMADALNVIGRAMENRLVGPEAAKTLRANARESYSRTHNLMRAADEGGMVTPKKLQQEIRRREGKERFLQPETQTSFKRRLREMDEAYTKSGNKFIQPILRGLGHLGAHAVLPYPANFFFYPTIHELARQAAPAAERGATMLRPRWLPQTAGTLAGQVMQSPDQSDEEE